MAVVENFEDIGPMDWGVGLEEDAVALYASGAEKIVAPVEIKAFLSFEAFRTEDTLIIARPTLLRVETYKALIECSKGEGHFQVVGHDPVRLANPDDIAQFRSLTAIVSKNVPVVRARGRPTDISYSLEQAEAILRLWYQTPRLPPKAVTETVEDMLNLERGVILSKAAQDPARWVKDLAIKYTGSAKRAPPNGWRGIEVDAAGRNVKYWEKA